MPLTIIPALLFKKNNPVKYTGAIKNRFELFDTSLSNGTAFKSVVPLSNTAFAKSNLTQFNYLTYFVEVLDPGDLNPLISDGYEVVNDDYITSIFCDAVDGELVGDSAYTPVRSMTHVARSIEEFELIGDLTVEAGPTITKQTSGTEQERFSFGLFDYVHLTLGVIDEIYYSRPEFSDAAASIDSIRQLVEAEFGEDKVESTLILVGTILVFLKMDTGSLGALVSPINSAKVAIVEAYGLRIDTSRNPD